MCGNGKHFRRRNQIKHRGWKAGGESGRCRVVYFGQNTGFAKGNEEKFDPFRIKRHQMFIKLLLCARLHSKHWGIYISEQKPHKIPFLVELALWRGETDDRSCLGCSHSLRARGPRKMGVCLVALVAALLQVCWPPGLTWASQPQP